MPRHASVSRSPATGALPERHRAGFTLVELVLVITLVGILSAVAAVRYLSRGGIDVVTYAEQMRAMVRYGQKLAIAQNRNVFVVGSLDGTALCYANTFPCPTAQIVLAPAGTNSGSAPTRAFCVTNNAYAANWYCEGRPATVTQTYVAGSASSFYFNGLGKPYLPGDAPTAANAVSQTSTFTSTTTFNFSGDGSSVSVNISPETGYVY